MLKDNDKVITMTQDEVFKSVLQDKNCEDYLVDIISGITRIKKRYVKDNLVFKNTELAKDEVVEKGKITDLLVELRDNIINLEMNKKYYDGLFDKNDRYLDKLKDGLVMKGEKYGIQRKVIQINFDNFEIFDDRIIIKFKMMDKEKGLIRSDYLLSTDVEIYHVNLKRVKYMYYNKCNLSKLQKEFLIMTLDSLKELTKVTKGYKEMEEVTKKISKLTREEEMQGIYIKEEQEEFIRQKIRQYAASKGYEQGMLKGKEEGIKEGIKEGKKQGIKEGKKQGIKEGSKEKEYELIKKMLDVNIDIKLIQEITGLSSIEIEKLRQ